MKKAAILFTLLIVATAIFVGVGYLLPDSYEVERSLRIDHPSAQVHAPLTNLERWPDWSALARHDPEATFDWSSEKVGVGARMAWKSETQGFGQLSITASDPEKGVWFDLELQGTSRAKGAILFSGNGQSTEVTWIERGQLGSNPIVRWKGPLMDSALGPVFEENLLNLAELVNSEAQSASDALPDSR